MRRTTPNLLEELLVIEAVHPDGFEGTPNAARWGADLLGRAIGHEAGTHPALDLNLNDKLVHDIFTTGVFTISQQLLAGDAFWEVLTGGR